MPKTYKSITSAPQIILDENGEIQDNVTIFRMLSKNVQDVNAYATFTIRNDEKLLEDLEKEKIKETRSSNAAGRIMGLSLPEEIKTRGKGESRKEELYRHNAISGARSWIERLKAFDGTSDKHVSQGWKRTANPNKPDYGNDYINLGAVDRQYSYIDNDPFTDGEIVLKLIINKKWFTLIFDFDNERFKSGSKVCLPLVYLKNDNPIFAFSVEFNSPVVQFSTKYSIGVDVGKNNYVTLSVVDHQTRKIVHSSTLSRRAHSLWNSIQASTAQIKNLRNKASAYLPKSDRMRLLDEAGLHRRKNVRKKRELAILAAQEIAEVSYLFDNAVVVFEDLSWVKNTMANGRWNRGELVRWATHYVSMNGGWVMKVNAAHTSTHCHLCGNQGVFVGWSILRCDHCSVVHDRDENAAANIALRGIPSISKGVKARSRNKNLVKQEKIRTPASRKDRTKRKPTSKRRSSSFISKSKSKEVNASCATAIDNMVTVIADAVVDNLNESETSKAGLTIFEYRFYNLYQE